MKTLAAVGACLAGTAAASAQPRDYPVKPVPFTAISYYAWANRGRGEMMVWLPTSEASARPAAYPTPAATATVAASRPPQGGNAALGALQDDEEPSSTDHGTHFDWWPAKGTTEWVQYTFEKPATISRSRVFWFDDSGRGECKVPASWRLLYRDGGQWKPVETQAEYTVENGAYNQVVFKPVTTRTLRLELTMQPNWSAGIHKWHVE